MSRTTTTSQPARTNRLIHATSPYLLQHAHNPVDWYPWGPEAIEKALKEDKPIFLSIGYSACHWCHVMERESFENEQIAKVLNEHYVSIKVDREERPDLDEIYMSATMLYNQGQGGWPMSVFLVPDGRPFFAGTYFPPESKWGRPGFKDLLVKIDELWEGERQKLLQSADALTQAVNKFNSLTPSDDGISADKVDEVTEELSRQFDPIQGGLNSGGTNKFPPSMAMSLMLRAYHRSRQHGPPKLLLLERVELTLERMANGGIYDHLGGGIARYSTDPQWLVPHFEKMLYDQGLVSSIYIEGYQVTSNKAYAKVAEDIFRYVLADLQSPGGGFYSARDADSEGVEGKFYVWSRSEIMSILGDGEGKLFCSAYDVTDAGNWEGHNILNLPRSINAVAKLHGLEPSELEKSLADSGRKLMLARAQRVPPQLDDKILTSWNGLMIAAMAYGGRVTGERKYTDAARKAADFVLTRMTRDGRLLRTCRKEKAHSPGYLDDYAFFVEGLLELYAATFEPRWLSEAIRLNDDMIHHFWDEQGGAFFFTADDAEKLLVRTKDTRDGAIPAGNSVALMNLLRLAAMLDRTDLEEKAVQTMRAFAGGIAQSPFGLDRFLAAVDFHHAADRKEIVIVGAPSQESVRDLVAAVNQVYDPYRVVLLLDPQAPAAKSWQERTPLLAGKALVDGKPAAYVCRKGTCDRPATSVEELRRQLQAR